MFSSTGSWSEIEFGSFQVFTKYWLSLSKAHYIQFWRCVVRQEVGLRWNSSFSSIYSILTDTWSESFWVTGIIFNFGDVWFERKLVWVRIWSFSSIYSILIETGSGSLLVSCILFNFWDVWFVRKLVWDGNHHFQVFTPYWQTQEVTLS